MAVLIIENEKSNMVLFGNLKKRELFEYNRHVFMKLEQHNTEDPNAVDLTLGQSTFIFAEVRVIPLKGTLTVE